MEILRMNVIKKNDRKKGCQTDCRPGSSSGCIVGGLSGGFIGRMCDDKGRRSRKGCLSFDCKAGNIFRRRNCRNVAGNVQSRKPMGRKRRRTNDACGSCKRVVPDSGGGKGTADGVFARLRAIAHGLDDDAGRAGRLERHLFEKRTQYLFNRRTSARRSGANFGRRDNRHKDAGSAVVHTVQNRALGERAFDSECRLSIPERRCVGRSVFPPNDARHRNEIGYGRGF